MMLDPLRRVDQPQASGRRIVLGSDMFVHCSTITLTISIFFSRTSSNPFPEEQIHHDLRLPMAQLRAGVARLVLHAHSSDDALGRLVAGIDDRDDARAAQRLEH